MTASRRLIDLTGPRSAERVTERSIIVQPVGAVEQHGAHLPLSTDLVIVSEVADALADEQGESLDMWVLPPLAYSKSNEHAWAAGTVWLSARTFLSVLEDVGRSVASLPARRLVFLNGHGGNTSLLDVACRELRLELGLMTFLTHPLMPADHAVAGDPRTAAMEIHGGLDETSLLLHLRPELVDMSSAEANVPTWLGENHHLRFGGSASFGWSSRDFGPSGVLGDPTEASAVHGKELFEAMVEHMGEVFAEIAAFELPPST